MKRIISVILILVICLGCLTGCSGKTPVIGFIIAADENSNYYRGIHDSIYTFMYNLELESESVIIKTIPYDTTVLKHCSDTAVELANNGCDTIFIDLTLSGYVAECEDTVTELAQMIKEVEFCYVSGVMADKVKLDNYHTVSLAFHDARYLSGVAAGMKLAELIKAGTVTEQQAKLGYVAMQKDAENISAYTAFFLGARSVCPSVTMDVVFLGDTDNEILLSTAAGQLILGGCNLISQQTYSTVIPRLCEEYDVYSIPYMADNSYEYPNTYITSVTADWTYYLTYVATCTRDGLDMYRDWRGRLNTESVDISDINEKAAAVGSYTYLDQIKAELVSGTRHPFDTSTFTLSADKNPTATIDQNGRLTGYHADIEPDDENAPDTQVVEDGYFHESDERGTPVFDLYIDGITILE